MTSKNKHGVYISFDVNDFDAMQRLYPDCYKEFIKRSVKLAVQDRSFFDSVFFNPSIISRDVRVK